MVKFILQIDGTNSVTINYSINEGLKEWIVKIDWLEVRTHEPVVNSMRNHYPESLSEDDLLEKLRVELPSVFANKKVTHLPDN